MNKVLIAVLWIACSVFDRGYLLGGLTAEFPSHRNSPAVTMMAAGGPVFLLPAVYMWLSGAPFMWHELTCQQRWEYFHQDSSSLSKEWFVHWAGNYNCRPEDLK